MDIGKLLNIARSIPKSKLKTDAGIKEVIRDLGLKAGKRFSERELDQYLSQFKRMAKTETPNSLMNKLSKKGIKQSDLKKIKDRLKKK